MEKHTRFLPENDLLQQSSGKKEEEEGRLWWNENGHSTLVFFLAVEYPNSLAFICFIYIYIFSTVYILFEMPKPLAEGIWDVVGVATSALWIYVWVQA